MKHLGKCLAIALVPVLCLMLASCGREASPAAAETQTPEASVAATPEADVTATPESSENADPSAPTGDEGTVGFVFDIMDETFTEGETVIKFPQLVNTNDEDRADRINKIIQQDLQQYLLDTMELAGGEEVIQTLSCKTESFMDTAISIVYTGVASTKAAAYPTNKYHTLTLNLVDGISVSLWDLFAIDGDFIQAFRLGMYSPSVEGLDLEKSGVDVLKLIDEQGTSKMLQNRFKEDATPFSMTEYGVIVSIEVPHAMGDHLEMAIPYETVEILIKTEDSTIWSNYLKMSGDVVGGADISEAGFTMAYYTNARFGFTLPHPVLDGESFESDNGDGITLTSKDEKYTVLIWGSLNLEPATGADLLASVKESVTGISEERSDGQGYRITFEGGDGTPVTFVECGYAGTESSVFFRISYPTEETEKFMDIVKRMEMELTID